MAKTRSKKGLGKEAQIAIGIGFFLAIFLFGGQLTGMATNTANMTMTISSSTSCALTVALPTTTSISGGTAATVQSDGSDGRITNDGNVDLLYRVNASVDVDGLFTDGGSTVTMDAVSGSTGVTLSDVTTLGVGGLETLCDLVETAEYCDFDFDVTVTASEPADTHVFEYDVECIAT